LPWEKVGGQEEALQAIRDAIELPLLHEELFQKFQHATPKGFLLTQRMEIESQDVDRIEVFSREVTSLIDAGIEFYSAPPEYYYTKLGELKLEMIASATRDGRTRAERIVEAAGGSLGALHYSNLGVFQITQPNSSAEFSWSGAYDTHSKRKTASVTIKLQFGLR